MLNIEQELESSGHPDCTVEISQYEDDCYLCRLTNTKTGRGAGSFYFDIRTGRHWDYRHGNLDNCTRIRPKAKMGDVARFYIHAGDRSWPKSKWVKLDAYQFSDGAMAAVQVKDWNGKSTETNSPYRFMVKREIVQAPQYDFHEWGNFRFASGEYLAPPWHDEPWVIKEHFAHASLENGEMIAYWKDAAAGQCDLVTQLTAGRYLSTYYGDQLTDAEIQMWVTRFEGTVELEFTDSTPDAIVDAYINRGAPHSCMAHPKSSYHSSNPVHPVAVYGAGDLAVCLMKRQGRVTGRALVWPEKMVAGRVYGDIGRMENALVAAGYALDSEDHSVDGRGEGLFDGARLLKIPIPNAAKYFVMPYLDFGYGIKSKGDHFVMDRDADCEPRNTDGTVHYPNGCAMEDDEYDACAERECSCHRYCDECSEWISIDELNTVRGGDRICNNCFEDYSRCDECNCYEETSTAVIDARDRTESYVCDDCLSDGATQIQGRWYTTDSLDENEDGELVLPALALEAAE